MIGINFENLNSLSGLSKLDESFLCFVKEQNITLYDQILHYRSNLTFTKDYSEMLISLASILDDFIAELFDITRENLALRVKHKNFDHIYECRRKFIQRYAIKKYTKDKIKGLDFEHISLSVKELLGEITQESISKAVLEWQEQSDTYSQQLDLIAQYCAFMVHKNSSLVLFDIPRPVNLSNHIRSHRIKQIRQHNYLGFNYRDSEKSLQKAAAHAQYCIYCHKREKDSCSHGISAENNGCPLSQKISEMNLLKKQGFNIGALAVIVIDNPLVAATGYRICNDCMKACIYQKQDPVNIPLIESDILDQVLALPWGVEIYLLLTKWNPLNFANPLPKLPTGYNILVTGLGPAGFALSHYLLNEGHNVTAIDGLKISPLHFVPHKLIKTWEKIKLPLLKKNPQGFGGVVEYGITNRWDKNNLSLVRLILERRKSFNMHGGVRLGSNITVKQAFNEGFDHIALCLGAGKPRFISNTDYFAKGVRSAADFLMNLQQGGAFQLASNSNLLIRMPAVVIGCGLTAIDSAVELLHYYPIQAEKFLVNWENSNNPEKKLDTEDLEIAQELIEHAKLFRKTNTDSEKLGILNQIGGVTICYRKTIEESPAYKLNHEEIEHAMAIGVKFEESLLPKTIHKDKYSHVESIEFFGDKKIIAKSILMAIGTGENDFQDINELDKINSDIFKNKDRKISYFGDCNQKYAGSVVKALASAKNGYREISNTLTRQPPKAQNPIDIQLKSYIKRVNILSDNIVEVIVHSPLCAKNFEPGQFFKLQNYSDDTSKVMESLALTGSQVDKENGLISLIVLEMGTSSSLCRHLKEGEEVVLMGPTGTPTEIVSNQNIVLIGGGLGNAVLVPIAKELKKNGCNIIYFAGYKKSKDRFYPERIEEFVNQVIWICDNKQLRKNRNNDLSIKGNIIDGILHAKNIGIIDNIDRVICIGSDAMMRAVSARKTELFGNVVMICSINSPMQCMMKGICGQCIQKTNDKKGYIFSCICQDQNSDIIDFKVLHSRLRQNSLLEKIYKNCQT